MFRRLPFVMGGFLATVAAVQALPAFAQDGSADGAVPTSAAVNLDKSVDPDADQSPASSMADTAMPLASNTPAQAAAPQPPTLQQAIGNPDDFTLSASIRARMESLGNDFRSTANPSDTILSLRTTLAAEYHPASFASAAN
ncbi:hypothetical protein [Novosphingobium sp. 9]|uniref:hypothetical protein n=1 Tax=Novosphingobium sp. 9 TaxID=2025349 RepID=UPI0021B58448|nr:hypothetical protein [Novosphingobium sp. 9]